MDAGLMLIAFLTLLVLAFSAHMIIFVPERLGREAGIWVVRKNFPSWPQTVVGELSWWKWLFVVVFTAIGAASFALMVTRLTGVSVSSTLSPYVIGMLLYERQLPQGQEPVEIALSLIIKSAAFFIVGFARSIFILGWHRFRKEGKRSTSPPVNTQ